MKLPTGSTDHLNNTFPIISVIIPCFNHGEYILEAINSVEQYPDKSVYEIIIINDGSTDEYTNNLLQKLNLEGYNVIFQENKGLGAARNVGISRAKGRYILPLDSDNKILPEYISLSIAILDEKPEISVVYGDVRFFGEQDLIRKVGLFDKNKLLNGNYIDACTVFRKSAWECCFGYKENMPYQGWEDWEFWLSLVEKNCQFYYISEVMFYYRVTKNSMISFINNNSLKMKILYTYIFYNHINLYSEYPDPITAYNTNKNIINELKEEYLNNINNLKNSKSYKIGNLIIKPFSKLKKWLFL
jgi:glycosyltransferase involved in cell wall biosynthesis